MKAYFIPGIAADCRLFEQIRLPEGFEPVFLNWIKPLKGETLGAYAIRLAERINQSEPFVVIGVSLGGIMASEISSRLSPEATIIIGSIPVSSQLPVYYKWLRKFSIHKFIPGHLYIIPAIIKNYFTRAPKENKKMVIRMILDADPAFIRWGIDAVLYWNNTQMPKNLVHVHGTRDEVFPYANTSPTHTIPKGVHMLILTHAEEINKIISETLKLSSR